ncbi:hypothetical protein K7J14_07090 [Treponema zuelzerae]|uniref:Uncharacterized protein n=1 Tax=Teretinema zuelzerae TaxID=156 RepID=A0AAE3EJ70_9SPIR|nr:hypothetical protein [Teretinema zuelzerae]MCD1654469.1 hypothetical protein [Teretinema zuelzerae]
MNTLRSKQFAFLSSLISFLAFVFFAVSPHIPQEQARSPVPDCRQRL